MRATFTPSFARASEIPKAPDLSDSLVDERFAADTIVISTPMWNFSIPSALKAWIAYVVRVERTGQYGPEDPVGLPSAGARLFIAKASGGDCRTEPATLMNHVAPYLKAVFRLMEVRLVTLFSVSGTAYRREVEIEEALSEVASLSPCGSAKNPSAHKVQVATHPDR